MPQAKNITGFTLIEIIVVMIVLSIIAVFSTNFIVDSTKQYVQSSDKNALLTHSRLAVEYMQRKLRNALPYSVRLTNANQCIQFLPITASGKYRNPVPSIANNASASGNSTPISVSPLSITGGAQYLSIGASSSDEIYGNNPGSLAAIQSTTITSITLTTDKQWLRNSVSQRFYILGEPQAFCLVGDEMRYYSSLSLADNSIALNTAYDLLISPVAAFNTLFEISSSTEDRNIRVSLSMTFSKGESQLDTIKEVVIRNVP